MPRAAAKKTAPKKSEPKKVIKKSPKAKKAAKASPAKSTMGRARRLYRGRHNDGWLAPPRFEVGAHVYCKFQDCWIKGHVVAHHWEHPEVSNGVHPYQVELDDGRLIYAPVDNDECINRVPRFDVGSYVQCLLSWGLADTSTSDETGSDCEQWATGRVVAHHYEESGLPVRPYQVQLEDGRLIYAPEDDDAIIKKAVFAINSKMKSNTIITEHIYNSWERKRMKKK